MAKIKVQDTEITVVSYNLEDYISLTDMAHSQMQEHIIFRWMSLKSTIEYLGEWEMLYNPDFNCTEFGTIKNAAGSNQQQETFEVTLVYNSLPHHASVGGVFFQLFILHYPGNCVSLHPDNTKKKMFIRNHLMAPRRGKSYQPRAMPQAMSRLAFQAATIG